MNTVFQELVLAGAPPEILYDYKPHVGTDLLVGIVAQLRQKILRLGGVFRFSARVVDWKESQGEIKGLVLADGEVIPAAQVILATGHSARDVYSLLARRGVALEPKPFAVGTRIEHPQELINQMQYGTHAKDPRLPTATYSFTHNFESKGSRKGVFTFCMCPGGEVVSSASEVGGTLVNGMSNSTRDGPFANSAVVVSVGPEDYGPGLLEGMLFQSRLEQDQFQAAGGYGATFQRLQDFMAQKPSVGSVESSFRMELVPGSLHKTLPPLVVQGLRAGFEGWSRVRSFINPAAVLIGHETRTSSPLRILRGESGASLSHPNLFPAGEGAGYAGGIVSAAVDGLRVVESGVCLPQEG